MASDRTVIEAISILTSVGIRAPDAWRHETMGLSAQRTCISVWTSELERFDDAVVLAAVRRYVGEAPDQFWPLPAKIAKIAESIERTLSGRFTPSADEAWGIMLALREKYTFRDDVGYGDQAGKEFETGENVWDGAAGAVVKEKRIRITLHADTAVRAALECGLQAIGGWKAFVKSGYDAEANEAPMAASFRRAYDAFSKRQAENNENTRVLRAVGMTPAPLQIGGAK